MKSAAFLASIMLVLGLVLTGRCWCDSQEIERSQTWPITRGHITNIKEDAVSISRRSNSGQTGYAVTISYAYRVNGKNYFAQQDKFLDLPNVKALFGRMCGAKYIYYPAEVSRLETDFAKGSATSVYYDPVNPSIAYIDNRKTNSKDLFTEQSLGFLMLIVAGGLLLYVSVFGQNR